MDTTITPKCSACETDHHLPEDHDDFRDDFRDDEPRQLANGFWVEPDGRTWKLARCRWLVRRPTFHPEPDFPEDLYTIEECDARITWYGDGGSSFRCEAGHEHHSYVATQGRWEYECELADRAAGGDGF